jgi:hypothetical protein
MDFGAYHDNLGEDTSCYNELEHSFSVPLAQGMQRGQSSSSHDSASTATSNYSGIPVTPIDEGDMMTDYYSNANCYNYANNNVSEYSLYPGEHPESADNDLEDEYSYSPTEYSTGSASCYGHGSYSSSTENTNIGPGSYYSHGSYGGSSDTTAMAPIPTSDSTYVY